jgi:hypothetical protein
MKNNKKQQLKFKNKLIVKEIPKLSKWLFCGNKFTRNNFYFVE